MNVLVKMTVSVLVMFAFGITQAAEVKLSKAVFAGGCFWCMEAPFDKVGGVQASISGYIGGHVKNPGYKAVSAGKTGHYEAIEITYDPARVSYSELLAVFWKNIDPLDAKGQFCDKGSQYLSAVFYADERERKLAQQSLRALAESGVLKGDIATRILPADTFYPAEKYHQNYYMKNPLRYKFYRTGCGRDKRLFELWGKTHSK